MTTGHDGFLPLVILYTCLMRLCSIDGCDRPATVRLDAGGFCRIHYIRERSRGRIPLLPRPADLERYRSGYNVDPETGCFIWKRTTDRRGYALFSINNKTTRVTRWIYEQQIGPIPDGCQLDHFVCSEPRCVNPAHLRPVTPRENVLRGDAVQAWNLAKTHCPNGHPYDDANTLIRQDGSRRCRQCSRDSVMRRRDRSDQGSASVPLQHS